MTIRIIHIPINIMVYPHMLHHFQGFLPGVHYDSDYPSFGKHTVDTHFKDRVTIRIICYIYIIWKRSVLYYLLLLPVTLVGYVVALVFSRSLMVCFFFFSSLIHFADADTEFSGKGEELTGSYITCLPW